MSITSRYSASISGFSHLMSRVPSLKKKNDVVGLLRREGIYDDVSEKEVIFLGIFDLIHVCYMPYNIHV